MPAYDETILSGLGRNIVAPESDMTCLPGPRRPAVALSFPTVTAGARGRGRSVLGAAAAFRPLRRLPSEPRAAPGQHLADALALQRRQRLPEPLDERLRIAKGAADVAISCPSMRSICNANIALWPMRKALRSRTGYRGA